MNHAVDRLKNNMEKARMIFVQEVRERLQEALESMEIIKTTGYDIESVNELYKFSHTLKGSGQTIGMFDIAEPASEMNTALKLFKDYDVKLEKGIITFLEERLEEIAEVIEENHSDNNLSFKIKEPLKEKKVVFVIDDDVVVTGLIQAALEVEGFKAVVFHETKEAEKHISIERPDLIILDIILSTENEGIEFCRKIRGYEYSKLIPIIFLTRKNGLSDKLKGFANGADDYMGKPFQVEELVARTHAIINRLEIQQNLILQDELTGTYNRRYLEQRLIEEISTYQRTKRTFSIVMVDIDFFKNINDEFGHAAGDEALQSLVELMHKSLRSSDVVCRYGGEEFVIILHDTPKDMAYDVIDRLREEVAAKSFILSKGKLCISMTISAGVASFDEDGTSGEELIASADLAMYNSKTLGRNKVSIPGEVADE